MGQTHPLRYGQHSQHTSTKNTHAHATDDTYHHSQTQMNKLVSGDIHYYSNKSQTHTAAHGDMTLQAHQSEMRLDSEQTLRIHSRDSIEIIAPDMLTLKAGGSGIEMTGGNVTLITPSQAGYKASKLDWGSGGGLSLPIIHLPKAKLAESLDYYLRYIAYDQDDNPIAHAKCLLFKPDGTTEIHTTDYEGKLKLIVDEEPQNYELHVIVQQDAESESTKGV